MDRTIDLVADIGEGFGDYQIGDDAAILETVSSANVACGFHAGDPRTMEAAVATCALRGVAVGAHPGFPDLVGFGRRTMNLTSDEIRTDVLYQLGALQAFARAARTTVAHVAPHGRLGNLAATDPRCAFGIVEAVAQHDSTLLVLTPTGELERQARARGLQVALLGYIDRAYEDDGTLVPRREPGAVIDDPDEIVRRAVELASTGTLRSRHGNRIEIGCDSLLLHGDNGASVEAARSVRAALEREGVAVRSTPGR